MWTIRAPSVQAVLEVLCQPAATLFNPLPLIFLPACVAGGQPLRQGHQPVQPLAGRPVQELHRLLLRRAAAHRQLPSAQDHRQGKLCEGQAGPPHSDGQGGESQGRRGSRVLGGNTKMDVKMMDEKLILSYLPVEASLIQFFLVTF